MGLPRAIRPRLRYEYGTEFRTKRVVLVPRMQLGGGGERGGRWYFVGRCEIESDAKSTLTHSTPVPTRVIPITSSSRTAAASIFAFSGPSHLAYSNTAAQTVA
jgi:hypothetical protein